MIRVTTPAASGRMLTDAELQNPRRRAYPMAMPALPDVPGPYLRASALADFPDDGNRYEVVYGELLVSPAPGDPHQEVLHRLVRRVDEYLDLHPSGHLAFAPSTVDGDEDTAVEPDLYVIPKAVARAGRRRRLTDLLLVVEVLSPSTTRADRFTKRRLYQEAGVPTYWIVDLAAEAIEVWTPSATFPLVARERVEWRAPEADTPLVLDIPALFAPI